jgi:hypothetical protein
VVHSFDWDKHIIRTTIYILRGHLICAAKEVPLNSDLALRDYNDNNEVHILLRMRIYGGVSD